jgi:ubiquinone/menaquinone biosynthesis C-methylase UbiE
MAKPDQTESVRRYFSGVAEQHSRGYNNSTRAGFLYSRRRDLVAAILEEVDGDRLLDVGCASAPLAPLCRATGFQYTGLDIDPEMISVAKEAAPARDTSSYRVGSVEQLDLPSESFDVVLALGVLEYVEEGELDKAVAELTRVLDDGGTLVLALLNSWSPIWIARRASSRIRGLMAKLRGKPAIIRAPETLFSRRRIRSLLADAGLAEVTASRYCFALVPSRIYARRPAFWAAVAQRLESLQATPLGVVAMGHLVVAKVAAPPTVRGAARPRVRESGPGVRTGQRATPASAQ